MTDKKQRGRPKGTTKAELAKRDVVAVDQTNEEILAELGSTDTYMTPIFGEANMFAMANGGVIPKLPGTLSMAIPRINDYVNQARWAIEFRGVKFIRGSMLRRRKFIISGFRHHHEDPKVIALFNRIARESKITKSLKSIQWEKDTVGWVVVWPDAINLMPQGISLLQGNLKIDRTMGVDRIFLQPDQKILDAIKQSPDRFPTYFAQSVQNNKHGMRPEIELEGAYLISATRDIGEAYPKSPMYPLFEPIKVIEALVETEYAISFAVKQLIMHIGIKGEMDSQGKQKFATKADIQTVGKQVMSGAKVATIVTDAGVEIKYVAPDKEIFQASEVTYNQAMSRIKDNIGIPMILVSGDSAGVSYSTATFIIKGFLQDVVDEREDLLNDFVYPWYRSLAESLYLSNPKKYSFLKNNDPMAEEDWNIPLVR